ncbi:MAG: hypothetical protein EON61_13765 [Alphaproteobacteria bacterium]|jgi:hypothetical protein|nr:MAG: hypothetical protein EON61_13765 [Alphaproteobacteria bacterium]
MMFDTFAVLTIQLARVYGIVVLIFAVTALLKPDRFALALSDFERSPGLTLLGAIVAVILGVFLITLHSVWTDLSAILVSLLGWLSLVKGALLLATPEGFLKLASAMSAPSRIRLWGIFALILGAIYLAIGLTAHATVAS